jgi:tRNA-(ms[2]io[6]A)-hydroxylase
VLGLKVESDPRWIERVMDDLPRLLLDHAHCELKAAANALSLSARAMNHPRVLRALTEIAEEELRHMRRVLDELDRRGLVLGPPVEDDYAARLRKAVSGRRRDKTLDGVLVDRLVVGAIIEARSCERFRLLASALAERDPALAAFYSELFEAEARHYRTLIDLAIEVRGDERAVRARLDEALDLEAAVVRELGSEPTMHG